MFKRICLKMMSTNFSFEDFEINPTSIIFDMEEI